ncbi:MAG TPA: Gfo/Idh/MocA family oxidoreductase [Bacteroidales bacterium]|nr:Gfo/Idh/MocA family oxidoreductase [Bacteroidales bacterium]HOK74254.1 Gfo/Idh/MocA family oxidoreductase [Bacteroidales bacterium]HOM39895.1 Gfo/Idh/MocA family oxidoreductase [Bacteroidales bacterium]HPP92244.1 Gfo/Idh/MocA family oxidoreductase [Bacteroidales bacterium]HQK70894.1 Gfo/Idh/MocA family oxidoreductase [Bacteroidales bacterium]
MKDIGRRKFIGRAALAGIGMAAAATISGGCKRKEILPVEGLPPVLKAAPKGRKLKAGLVGAGGRGTGAAINFISAGPDLEIVAVADVFQDKVDAFCKRFESFGLPIPPENRFTGFDGYKKLMAIDDIDVVILATPPKFRPEHFLEAVTMKKHVFMEKPVAVDSNGIRTILATAKKAEALGLNVVTGTQRRHQEDYIETYKKVAEGAIGRIVAAKAWWNQDHVWFRLREPGWNDMEYMIRNWNNFIWLSGDHILDTHVHNIDVVNWFTGKHPVSAIGYGGRHRRVTGDQYDFFSIDFDYGNGVFSHSMCRQIDGCANGTGELVVGTEGYTNCQNTIWNLDGKVIWKFEYPKDENGNSTNSVAVSPYIQEHMHLVWAIRTGNYVNEAEQTAISTLTAIMGRTAAYTGKMISWDEILKMDMNLGPSKIEFGPVDMKFEPPVPGLPVQI